MFLPKCQLLFYLVVYCPKWPKIFKKHFGECFKSILHVSEQTFLKKTKMTKFDDIRLNFTWALNSHQKNKLIKIKTISTNTCWLLLIFSKNRRRNGMYLEWNPHCLKTLITKVRNDFTSYWCKCWFHFLVKILLDIYHLLLSRPLLHLHQHIYSSNHHSIYIHERKIPHYNKKITNSCWKKKLFMNTKIRITFLFYFVSKKYRNYKISKWEDFFAQNRGIWWIFKKKM